ncbi:MULTISPECIES: rod shape-determining protein [Solibacillus]|uniref:rod shape-determining protein n=1 Tax=Solibacillus TaxID=648800 RepID=UPI0007FB5378|nr:MULTISPECIES: rod shape-determining protein [Solibacillus]OBW54694.1 rod shape-determining protein [Solibacillus silvestris]
MQLFQKSGPGIGIDLGTANTLVYVKNKGIVYNEPSILAKNTYTQKVIAVGHKAKVMQGRTHGSVETVRPIRDGVVADFQATTEMIQHYVKELTQKRFVGRKPFLVVSAPTHLTSVERRAVIDAALQAGAKEAIIIEETFAAAIGAGLPVWEPSGSMIVDIGGGTTDVAILSLGGVVVSNSIKVAGDEMDRLIIKHTKNTHQLIIGEATAEKIKINVFKEEVNGKLEVRGRDMVTGLPKTVNITASEISSVLEEAIDQINLVIKQTLEQTPPELASDIIERGLLLSGGIALLPQLEKIISDASQLPVILAETPLESVAKGTARIVDEPNIVK